MQTTSSTNARPREHRKRRRGTTLIEVLIVIAIMTLISTVAALSVIGQWEAARRESAAMNARGFRSAAVTWRMQQMTDECPTTARLLADKMTDKATPEKDPWGTAYKITCEDDDVTVTSAGKDRAFGTADDVIAPPPPKVAKP